MKSFTLAAALLASAAVAQPHGHHHRQHDKRELVVEIATEWVTATVIIGDEGTSTIPPPVAPAPATSTGAEFFEPSTTLVPQVAPAPPSPSPESPSPAPQPTTQQAAPVVQSPSPAAQSPSPIVEAAPVVASSPAAAAPVVEAPASSGSSGGSNKITKTGDVTYYDVGMGSCGFNDTLVNETGFIAAISADVWNSISTATNYGENMPANPICNGKVTITAGGNSVEVTVRDKCPGCDPNAIDITRAAYEKLFGSLTGGRQTGTWSLSW